MPISPYVSSMRERIGHDLLLLPAVSAVIRNEDGQVLLARSHADDRWGLIGGGLEPGEDPIEAIAREILEELGVEANVGDVIGAYGGEQLVITYPNGDRCAYVTTAYACRLLSDAVVLEAEELHDVAWCDPVGITWLETQPYVPRILADAGIRP
ncbi:NUDIX domain-containing protein [Microbacterium karelineae]|uniref:NUDIX domain-containing protein n=1 Tax=Microbacterium karelineae TaxID=2654283 RepID=UPI0012E9CAFD|nr:NUDIX domain-containing protein [Microbacterium karelineae]